MINYAGKQKTRERGGGERGGEVSEVVQQQQTNKRPPAHHRVTESQRAAGHRSSYCIVGPCVGLSSRTIDNFLEGKKKSNFNFFFFLSVFY